MIGDLRFRVRRAWGLGGPSKMKGRPRFDRAWARVACPCTNATRGSPSCMHVEGSRLPTTAMKGLPSIDHGQGSLYLAVHWQSQILRFTPRPWPGNLQNPAPEGRILAPRTRNIFGFHWRGRRLQPRVGGPGGGLYSLGNLRVSR